MTNTVKVSKEHVSDEDWKSVGQALVDVALETGWFKSKSDFRRHVEQGAVKINDEKITDPTARIVHINNKMFCLERQDVKKSHD
jgi:tyrosyl-tRNA synthetase